MADYCVLPSCAKLQLRRIMPRANLPMTRNFGARNRQRECLIFVKSLHTSCFSFSRSSIVQAPFLICANESRGLNENFSKCYCWGMLIDPENAAPSNLAFAMDEMLLMVSVILAYMAGAVPQRKKLDFMSHHTKDNPGSSSPTTHGRSERSESLTSLKTNAIWHEVNGKLLDALEATGNGANLDDLAAGITDFSRKDALSLFALNHGPTWRLLWSTLMRLQKEVSDIHSSREAFNGGAWLAGVSEIFKEIVIQILFKWLEQELFLGAAGYNMNPVIQLTEKLKGNDGILNNIKRSGKTEIYADLIFFLRFNSLRLFESWATSIVKLFICETMCLITSSSYGAKREAGCDNSPLMQFLLIRSGCCFDKNFLVEHGVEVLEDLVITLADAVASIYLELISVDSDLSIEINSLGSRICPLSTRALQRLRNEVLLKQWLQQNFESVVSLYEDRFELFVLSRLKMGEELENQTKTSVWQKLAFSKRAISSASNCVQIKTVSLTVKRTKELQALTGWRYYFSLFLEFSDVAMPLVKAVFEKARSAVSFFLMCMIGRSLGLVFSGIRQSLGWK